MINRENANKRRIKLTDCKIKKILKHMGVDENIKLPKLSDGRVMIGPNAKKFIGFIRLDQETQVISVTDKNFIVNDCYFGRIYEGKTAKFIGIYGRSIKRKV